MATIETETETDKTDRDVCSGCGSTPPERQRHGGPQMRECPHCGADKCCLCDMGDDVWCGACPDHEG